jgi:ribosomal protein L35AE/L33A
MYLSVPPKHSPAFVMKMLKGKSAEYLRKEIPELGKLVRGYFVSPVGIDGSVRSKFEKNSLGYGMTAANDIVRSCRH